jgi:hypothetical protein
MLERSVQLKVTVGGHPAALGFRVGTGALLFPLGASAAEAEDEAIVLGTHGQKWWTVMVAIGAGQLRSTWRQHSA